LSIGRFTHSVIPAQAGIHSSAARATGQWIPAFAGMTIEKNSPGEEHKGL